MLNQAQIIGHLGRDPEIRYLPSGEAVANFSIATTEKWKDKNTGEQREETEWHRISVFGRLAEIVGEYLKKGSLVFVQGKLKTRKYTDGQGVERYSTEIRAEALKMLGGRDSSQGERSSPPAQREAAPQQQRQQPPARQSSGFDDMDDDIPFD